MKQIVTLACLFIIVNALGQLKVQRIISIEDFVKEELFGEGVEVKNVKYQGRPYAIVQFSQGESTLEMSKGLFLCTGHGVNVLGPNNHAMLGSALHTKGDKDLNKLVKEKTMDAAVLEFDFIPQHKYISFNYIFGSEEYLEYVNKDYNDVFALFLKVPGKRKRNLALIPGTNEPIAINNVNHLERTVYYVNNELSYSPLQAEIIEGLQPISGQNRYFELQYDGFTRVLQAISEVKPGEVHHIKIAVADVKDMILDSGVFIEAGSFNSHKTEDFKYGVLVDSNYYKSRYLIDSAFVAEYHRITSSSDTVQQERTIVKEKQLSFKPILFDFDDYRLNDEAKAELKRIIKVLKEQEDKVVKIEGHTDSYGSDDYNLILARNRAMEVAKYIKKNSDISFDVSISFYGEKKPKVSNNTPMGRNVNRRVDVSLKEW